MKILRDLDLETVLNAGGLIRGAATIKKTWQIKPASLDLTIGKIYLPGVANDAVGGAAKPIRKVHSLSEGGSAVVETAEELILAANQVAIVFLPNAESFRGLLTTNPGLIDPGFEGLIRLTLINMGREPFELRGGDRILRVVIFELDQNVRTPYTSAPLSEADIEELLARLSEDFLSVSKRIEKEVTNQDTRTRNRQIAVTVWLGALTIIGTAASLLLANGNAERQFGSRITTLETKVSDIRDTALVDKRMTALQEQIDVLQKRLDARQPTGRTN